MKYSFIIFFVLFPVFILAQNKNEFYVYNVDGVLKPKDSLFKFNHKTHHVWGIIKNDSVIYKHHKTQPITYKINYEEVISKFKNSDLVKHPNAPLLIDYNFKNDNCHNLKLNKEYVISQKNIALKEFSSRYKNVNYIQIYERGINIKYLKDCVYIDNDDFFRKNIFIQPALCGAVIVIYPNNTYKISYGEGAIFEVEKN